MTCFLYLMILGISRYGSSINSPLCGQQVQIVNPANGNVSGSPSSIKDNIDNVPN